MRRGITPFLPFLLLAGAACGDDAPECRVGADCASGVCLGDGTCAPTGDADARTDDGAPEATDELDLPPEDDGDDAGEIETIGCLPDRDGVITREEVPVRAGLRATFRIGLDATVDLAGTTNPDGSRSWDLLGPLAGDHDELIELLDPTGRWFAPTFPTASYAARLSDTEELLGVFEITADALQLLGVVSPEGGLLRTELTYDPPVTVLAFPLELGDSWTTDSTVSGFASGVWSMYFEAYESQVDAAGTLATPYETFDVLRVGVQLTRTVGVVPTVTRTFSFVSECFGTVATATSQPNPLQVEFSEASEVRRLAP